MQKRISIVTIEQKAKELYVKELTSFFGGSVKIEGCSIAEGIPQKIDAELLILTSPTLARSIRSSFDKNIEIVFITRTFLKNSIQKLDALPFGTKAMLVDYSYDTCMDIISALYKVGVNHIDFVPMFPPINKASLEDVDTVVTAGMLEYVPARSKHVIDIGWTVIDISTIMEVATKLDIFNEEIENRAVKHASNTTPVIKSLVVSLQHSSEIRNHLNVVMDLMEDAVIVLNDKQQITYYNMNMASLLKVDTQQLLNAPFSSLLNIEPGFNVVAKKDVIKNHLIHTIRNKSFIVSKRPIIIHSYVYGFVIITKDVTEIQNLEVQLRKKMIEKGYVAKYNFTHVIGTSARLQECITKAKKIAKLESSVMITGESGTGKELVAQSIHNESKRAKKPFIAINCAALPPDLLESELFGYEEGAFTSAKKGGKAGLFELAHTGTLFLDEIGDIPLKTQSKLLRVLQEKEVMRIGGDSIKPVDVRIIAATNQDLSSLVAANMFRKDLYFRINVFVLELPPLRDRIEDIPCLISQFLNEHGARNKKLDSKLLQVMLSHKWDGNIRELNNCIQYMSSMGGEYLTIDDLPPHFNGLRLSDGSKSQFFLSTTGLIGDDELTQSIIEILKVKPMGREGLHNYLLSKGIHVSEYRIRKTIQRLRESGKVTTKRGRGGIQLR